MREKTGKISRRGFLRSATAIGAGAFALMGPRAIITAAAQGKSGKVWTMKYDCYITSTAPTAQLDNWFLDTVAERSKGQVKFEKYWASSLHKVGEHLPAVRDGLSEISMISYGYYPAMVPLSRGLEWYFMGCDHADTLLKVCRDMYATYQPLRDEWEKKNNCKVLYFTNWDYCPLFMKKPISKVEELKGLRIRGYGVGAETIDRLGGRGMPVVAGEVYQALERGILDGVFAFCFITAEKMKLYEQAPNIIEIGAGAHAPTTVVMNLDLWNSLPKDLKDVFEMTANDIYEWKYLELYSKLLEESLDIMMDKGAKFTKWSDEEIKKATAMVQPAQVNDWAEKVAKPAGYNGYEFLDKVRALIAKYEAEAKLKNPYEIYESKYLKKGTGA
jgi:TRAP-type C4-dicarboxylate transport system substrate-binding protein